MHRLGLPSSERTKGATPLLTLCYLRDKANINWQGIVPIASIELLRCSFSAPGGFGGVMLRHAVNSMALRGRLVEISATGEPKVSFKQPISITTRAVFTAWTPSKE